MSIALVINGTTYDYPEVDDVEWGPDATDWAAAVTSGMLQKAGGLFQLLAEVDFGTAYGVKALYLKSRTASVASAGQIRFAKTDVLSWKNNAGDGNLDLGINGSDVLTFNGTAIQSVLSVSDTATIDLTLSSAVLSADIKAVSIDNSMISTSAAIAYSKLALTGSIVNADVSSSAAIAYSKLNLSSSIVNADVSGSAAIAYSKLALTGSIVNADLSASAAIAYSKLASLTSAHILVGSAGNVATDTAVTGDVTISNAGVTAIGANKVTNAMLATVATATFKGRTTAGTGNSEDLTVTQATALLNNMVGDSGSGGTKGLAPAPAAGDAAANKFLKANGVWTTPPGAGDVNGPGSSTDNAVARFDGTLGKTIQNSGVIVDDSNNVSGVNDLAVGGNSTLTGTLEVDSLDASKAVVTNGSKVLASLAYASANTASTLVQRDASGNFTAGTITAALSGNATTATSATSATSATNATNTAITDDTTTNATMYPTWVTTTTGNLPQKISSTKLTFNPSTAALTTTTVVAAVTGTASGNTTISGQTNHGVVVSGSANAMTSTAAGSSGQPLLSGGSSADPAYGTLAIGAGGTGQVTKAAAFDALSPMSAGGDLIYGGASGTGTRLPNGSLGQYLKSAGGTSAPVWTSFTAGAPQIFTSTGTTAGYWFNVSSANATVGATYTNNTNTFTVLSTISSGTTLFCSGVSAPQASGTLTKATGTGDSTITFSANHALATYTPTSGCLFAKVTVVGGGGGGGGMATAATAAGGGGGGGAGGTAFKWYSNPTAMYYSVGAAGAGGTAGANDGTGGVSSTFNAGAVFATAGNGGRGGTATNGAALYVGSGTQGLGGTPTGGDTNSQGGPGGYGMSLANNLAVSGNGGNSSLGGGGLYQGQAGAGHAGGGYGSGGSGGNVTSASASAAGGDGTAGIVIVEEFFP